MKTAKRKKTIKKVNGIKANAPIEEKSLKTDLIIYRGIPKKISATSIKIRLSENFLFGLYRKNLHSVNDSSTFKKLEQFDISGIIFISLYFLSVVKLFSPEI